MICTACQAENDPGAEVCFTCGRAFSVLTQGALVSARYEIRGLLGKGGMGMVYKAYDTYLDEEVAIKVLRREFVGTSAMAERFRSEIKLARKVSHPNVCRIHEYGEDADMSYISMELLEGKDLKQRLGESPGGLPHDEALSAVLQIAKGLAAIHEVGIIHRDLKTPNAMRDAGGTVKLMDFGIAKDTGGQGQTATGQVMGTPEYMSPEQCRGEKLDFRSDIYALGIVTYELFTGEVPFRGENMMATLFKQIQDPVPFDGPAGSRVPRYLVPVLQRALAKWPQERYETVADMYAALRDAIQHGSAVETPAPAPQPPPAPAAAPRRGFPETERRRQSRLEMTVEVFLCRLDSSGAVLHRERTVADNLSRGGARVMTSVPDLAVGDEVVIQEVSGDFSTPALVRHAFLGADNIPRVGLEFRGQTAPDRLVLTESERVQTPRHAPRAEAVPPPAGGGAERRRHNRLGISVDIQLRRLGPGPAAGREERTVADNISRAGARVLTSMTDLKAGDKVALREIGGDFETEAVVRNAFVGADRIPRLGLEFLGTKAPDRLVPPSQATRRLRRPPATRPPGTRPPATPAPTTRPPDTPPPAERGRGSATGAGVAAAAAVGPPETDADALERLRQEILELREAMGKQNHFEMLGISRRASESEVKAAYLALAKRYHPDAPRDKRLAELRDDIQAIFVRVGQAYDVLRDPEQRPSYERRLGPDTSPPRPRTQSGAVPVASVGTGSQPAATAEPPPQPAPPPAVAGPPPPETEEQRVFRIEVALRKGRQLLAAGGYWDAIQLLEPLLDETDVPRLKQAIRLLLAQAMAKNPNWVKRAEELALLVVRDEPGAAEAHFLLGTLYRQVGLTHRARTALRRVLELHPGHEPALAELAALDLASKDSRR